MACREIVQMREQVMDRMRGNVDTWQYNLQARWGDPRVYAAEQQAMQRQEAAVAYNMSRRNTQLLDDAYTKQRAKQAETHNKRLTKSRAGGKRPGSRAT
jgi:hypothetical protein